ncbi:ADP-ribosylglycohydrolase family protein [Dactylosporangium maewongense]
MAFGYQRDDLSITVQRFGLNRQQRIAAIVRALATYLHDHRDTMAQLRALVLAQDTVPFALWAAATHLADYRAAILTCVAASGDVDTTAAIVGGVVAAAIGRDAIPAAWRTQREPLPAWVRTPGAD